VNTYELIATTVISSLVLSASSSNASYDVPTTGLIGYWSGNNAASDASIVHNNGSFGGSYVAGPPVGGKAFNLATGKVSIANNAAYNFKSYAGWSVGFWFDGNGTPISASNGLFLGQDNGSGFQPKWFLDYSYSVYGNNSCFNFHVNDFNQERIFASSQSVLPPTGWNQMTVTVDNTNSGTVAFYLNGQSIGTTSMGNYALATTAPLIFGQAEGLSFSGLMSHVVIYNRVLSTNEVLQLASASVDLPFTIINESLNGSGNVVISWQSVPGRIYQVVRTATLGSPISWTEVGGSVLATSTNTSATIPPTSPISFISVRSP
jgi:hypothetical protein